MVPEPLLFAFALFDTGAVLFLLVYFITQNLFDHLPTLQVITLSDLECDYLNAQQCCAKLNMWVLPKIVGHVFLLFLLLCHGQWLLMMFNTPMAVWLVYEYLTVPNGNMGIYDPTEIHNHGQLKKHLRDCMVYLGYYLIFFFIYLYCMIIALLKGDPIRRNEDDMVEF